MRETRARKQNDVMDAEGCHGFILDFFHAHAIKGAIRHGRTYEVISKSANQLRIESRMLDGRHIQTLFADLLVCKSLKYGEYRRVDLFWGMEHKNGDGQITTRPSPGASSDDDSFRVSLPGPTFLSNGELMPVDAFINRRLGRSKRSSKEKTS